MSNPGIFTGANFFALFKKKPQFVEGYSKPMRSISVRKYSGNCLAKLMSLRLRADDAWLYWRKNQSGAKKGCAKGAPIDESGSSKLLHPTPRLLSIIAIAVGGVALSCASYYAIADRESRAVEQEFISRAKNITSVLQTGLNESLDKIVALQALFDASGGTLSRHSFGVFADRILQDQKAILHVSWVPRIRRDERAAIELAAARDGISDYHIKSVAADSSLAIAAEKEEYYPIYYKSEERHSGSALGLDSRRHQCAP